MRFSITMRFLVLCLLCGCGRIDFELRGDAEVHDAEVPFVEPTGQLDTTFGGAGFTIVATGMLDAEPYAVVERAGGGYLALGVHQGTGTNVHFGVFAFTQSGVLDTAFAPNGIIDMGPTNNDFGYGAIRGADGRTAIVGDGNDGLGDLDNLTIAMLDSTGRLDPSFAAGGFQRIDVGGLHLDDTLRGVVFLADRLVVCGTHDYVATDSRFTLAALGLDGTPLAGFGTAGIVTDDFASGVKDECSALVQTPSGDFVASGRSGARAVVAAYRPDGTRDPGFASGGFVRFAGMTSTAFDIVVAPDGDLVAVGDSAGVAMIARFAPDGTPRASFGQGGIVMLPSLSIAWAVTVQPNGKIIATGQTLANGSGVVVRLMPDGTLDQTFGSGGTVMLPTGANTELEGLLLQADGSIVTAGFISGTPDRAVIARIR